MKRRYLSLTTLDDALVRLKNAFPPPRGRSIRIHLLESEGRITSEAIYARCTVPNTAIAELDGIAVKSIETIGAGEQRPVTISDYLRVDTGNVVPPHYDAVIPIEDIQLDGTSCITRKSARKGQCIRPAGQDVRKGDLIVPGGHQIRPSDISALATYGYDHVNVRVVRVGIIPVGNELVPLGKLPGRGKVVESNSITAVSFLSRLGALCTRFDIVPDEPSMIEKTLDRAISSNDLVLLSSGTSAGRFDYTADAISRLGRLIFHGIAMLPGKPAMLGEIDGKPVIGLPGYPVGSQTVLRELVMPLLVSWGLAPVPEWVILGRLARAMPSELGFDEFIPVSIGSVDGCIWAFPHPRGSGLQMNLVRANGYLHIPPHSEGWEAGGWARIHCTALPHLIERALLCVGAKNQGLALAADALAENGINLHMIGDQPARAILALQKKSCNLVAVNVPGINPQPDMYRAARNMPVVSIHIGRMMIGIVSRKGAGKGDLADLRLMNAPGGSTARMYLDLLLSAQDILPDQILGDSNVVKTEYAVVAAVKEGIADAGICSMAHAADSGLSFVPVTYESHDVFIREESLDDERVRILIDVLQSPEFQLRLRMQGGYNTADTGRITSLLDDSAFDYEDSSNGEEVS
ncbi:MAG: molybdenum cofactor biosynthesis protein [Methanomicrobiaceae archaeon]|uniref:MoaB/Mog domain-containing protein n=1 Tax=hydrocarbon metagenome TaxID=938273 RepID=A0A0W8FF43_9ZZZZ|nr:molybdenum cofactor biosynthesis protein [Methanomicrobiaceae archaeon]